MRSILAGLDPVGWYNLTIRASSVCKLRMSTRLRLCGLGFKAASRPLVSPCHGIRAWRYLGVYLKSILQFELWATLLLGIILYCYVYGRLVAWLVEVLAPRDPVLPPSELFAHSGMEDFNSYFLYRVAAIFKLSTVVLFCGTVSLCNSRAVV